MREDSPEVAVDYLGLMSLGLMKSVVFSFGCLGRPQKGRAGREGFTGPRVP